MHQNSVLKFKMKKYLVLQIVSIIFFHFWVGNILHNIINLLVVAVKPYHQSIVYVHNIQQYIQSHERDK